MRRCKPRPEAQEQLARQPAKAEAPIVFVDDDDEAMPCGRVMGGACRHDVGMRPELKAARWVGGFVGPANAQSDASCAVGQRVASQNFQAKRGARTAIAAAAADRAAPKTRRDAVCPPQAHPEARSPSAARSAWRARRVHARSHRTKPTAARQNWSPDHRHQSPQRVRDSCGRQCRLPMQHTAACASKNRVT